MAAEVFFSDEIQTNPCGVEARLGKPMARADK